MGFRSTFITEGRAITWPDWFRAKYADLVRFPIEGRGMLSSSTEAKQWMFDDLTKDIQLVIDWSNARLPFVMVFLHECGGITRCEINEHEILWSEPWAWRKTEEITHSYCYGCSDWSRAETLAAPLKRLDINIDYKSPKQMGEQMSEDYPWIRANDATGTDAYMLSCLRCGYEQRFQVPMTASYFIAVMAAFQKEHEGCCEEVPE